MTTNIWAGALLVILAVVIAVYISIVLRRKSPRGGFFSDPDRAASIFSAIGTMFSVLLALVILLSVETYTQTKSHANAEADSVLGQYQIASLFPSRDQYQVQSNLVCYSRGVIYDEWPLMRQNRHSLVVDEWSRSVNSAIDTVEVRGGKAEVGFELFLEQSLERQEQRRGRLEGAEGTLPDTVWPILVLGALSLLAYVVYYADRAERLVSQAMQVGLVTALLGSSLVLISALDHPFSTKPGQIMPDKMLDSLAFMEHDLALSIDAPDLSATLPCDGDGRPKSTDPIAKTFPEGSTMARIVQKGKIVIGVSHSIALFGEIDPLSGRVNGFDVDLAREIAWGLGLREDQIEFVDTLVQDRIFRLQAGALDMVVLAMTITPERADHVKFSRPYYVAGQSILVKRGTGAVSSLRDLSGRTACVLSGSTNAAALREMSPTTKLMEAPTIPDCVKALKAGEVDAVSTDDIILAGFAAQDEELILVGGQFTVENYGVALPRGQEDMAEFVNGVIEDMVNDGRWGRLYYSYLGDIPGLAPVDVAKDRLSIGKSE